MLIREYNESDLDSLRAIHAAQGFDYALPDLRNPLFVTKLVLLDGEDVNVAPGIGPTIAAEGDGAYIQSCHSVYNEDGSVKTNFAAHFFRSVFSSPERIFFFPATKVRSVIVRRNILSSTIHLFGYLLRP